MLNTFQVPPCPRQAVVFRKSALSEVGAFDEKFKLMADYDLMIRLVMNGYKGVLFDGTIVTCKVVEQTLKHTDQA